MATSLFLTPPVRDDPAGEPGDRRHALIQAVDDAELHRRQLQVHEGVTGRMLEIISDEMSVKQLTRPSSQTVGEIVGRVKARDRQSRRPRRPATSRGTEGSAKSKV